MTAKELFNNKENEQVIKLIAKLRDVFDWPEETNDWKSPLYYNIGEIAGSPIGCLQSIINITEYRNKKEKQIESIFSESRADHCKEYNYWKNCASWNDNQRCLKSCVFHDFKLVKK